MVSQRVLEITSKKIPSNVNFCALSTSLFPSDFVDERVGKFLRMYITDTHCLFKLSEVNFDLRLQQYPAKIGKELPTRYARPSNHKELQQKELILQSSFNL